MAKRPFKCLLLDLPNHPELEGALAAEYDVLNATLANHGLVDVTKRVRIAWAETSSAFNPGLVRSQSGTCKISAANPPLITRKADCKKPSLDFGISGNQANGLRLVARQKMETTTNQKPVMTTQKDLLTGKQTRTINLCRAVAAKTILLLGLLVMLAGSSGCSAFQEEKPSLLTRIFGPSKAQREKQFRAKVIRGTVIGGGIAVGLLIFLGCCAGDSKSGNTGGPNSGSKPTAPITPNGSSTPVRINQPISPVISVPVEAARSTPPTPITYTPNGCTVDLMSRNSVPQANKALESKHFVIDGTNICRSYVLDNQFHLESLLGLAAELLRRGQGFECYFDATTRYQAVEKGSPAQLEAYLNLLNRYPVLFREVPGGESADDYVLLRANTERCGVISNDRFAKPEDDHLTQYPWLKVRGRLVRGRIFQGRLIIAKFGIDQEVPTTLAESMKAFEGAMAAFRPNTTRSMEA